MRCGQEATVLEKEVVELQQNVGPTALTPFDMGAPLLDDLKEE